MAHLSEIKTARLSSALILPPSSPLIDRPRISLTLDADPTPYIEIVLPHRELEKIGRYSDLSVRACFQRIKKDFPDILSRESVDEQIRNIPESFTNRTAIIRNIRALFRTQASNESLPYGSYIHLRVRGAVNGCESDEILTKRAGRSHYEFRDTPEVVQRAEEAVKELTVRYKDKRDKGVFQQTMRIAQVELERFRKFHHGLQLELNDYDISRQARIPRETVEYWRESKSLPYHINALV